MSKTEKTTIAVSKDTARRLAKLGTKGDTYEDIVRRLLDASLRAATG